MDITNNPIKTEDNKERKPSNYRWFVLLLAWTALQAGFVDRLIWANVSVVVGESLSLPLAALGIFVTAFYIGYVIANALGGFASDRLGPKIMIFSALVPLGIGTYLFGDTKSIVYGLMCQALMGLGGGINYSACIKLVMNWFEKKERGRAMGILTTATSLGVVIVNAIVPTLMNQISWQGVYHLFGIITFALGILIYLGLWKNPPIQEDAVLIVKDSKPLSLFKDKALIWIALAGFCAMWGTWGFTFWANALMVREYQIQPVQAGAVVLSFGIGAIIAKPLVGWLSDKWGGKRKPLLISIFIGFFIMLLIFGHLSTLTMFKFTAPILGVVAFAYTPLLAALVGETVGLARTGAATGVTNAIWQLGSLIAPSVVGLVYQASVSFSAAFLTLAIGPFFAVLAMLKVKEVVQAPNNTKQMASTEIG